MNIHELSNVYYNILQKQKLLKDIKKIHEHVVRHFWFVSDTCNVDTLFGNPTFIGHVHGDVHGNTPTGMLQVSFLYQDCSIHSWTSLI